MRSIADIYDTVAPLQLSQNPEYVAKMLHDIPRTISIDRVAFILDKAKGKRIIEFGATGTLHGNLLEVAAVNGIDKEPQDPEVQKFDLDLIANPDLPQYEGIELIVCGEIIEHLANTGFFLERLKRQYAGVPLIITVPNAFTVTGRKWLRRGQENVNVDHVAWYSYRTLKTLLSRYDFDIKEFYWYDGDNAEAAGLVVVAE